MFLNLKLVQQQENLLGQTIVQNYTKSPAHTLDMIKEHYQTHPEKVIETLGKENVEALGLMSPTEKFLYYYPVKQYQEGHNCLIFNFKSFSQVFGGMQRAKHIIEDLRLNLKVRTLSYNSQHKLYIDFK